MIKITKIKNLIHFRYFSIKPFNCENTKKISIWNELSKKNKNNCLSEDVIIFPEIDKETLWRSAAFIINGVIDDCFKAQNYGFDINESGFYCDNYIKNKNLSPDDFPLIEQKFSSIVNLKIPFERLIINVDTAKSIYRENSIKLNYIDILHQKKERIVLYKCGDIVDVCQWSLARHSGQLGILKLLGNGSVKCDVNDDENSLQRIYGILFPNKSLLKEWTLKQEEAKKLDHRRIGHEQKLFFFHSSSSGSPFMLPHGTHICNKLVEFIREQYKQRDFKEVITPNIYNCDLWKTSGHWDLYQENLFKISLDNEDRMSLKPMNCPGHCLIYSHEERFHDDLPLRLADFGALHRDEPSGSLNGLTRLRKFHQDDGHIFCRDDQIIEEIRASLDFLQYVYKVLDFKYTLSLSTRPERYLGDIEMWNLAEKQLKDCLDQFGCEWLLNDGDGAFYGPKIDITITDALGRMHQCATIQLDFQLPLRFDLKYTIDRMKESYGRPVIIHRAILGSVERLLAIMIESNAGKWPFWLNPRQILVVPVSHQFNEYSEKICKIIRGKYFMCDVDLTKDRSLNKKIRIGQLHQYSCILVLGKKEMDGDMITLRTRDGKINGIYHIHDLLKKFESWQNERTLIVED